MLGLTNWMNQRFPALRAAAADVAGEVVSARLAMISRAFPFATTNQINGQCANHTIKDCVASNNRVGRIFSTARPELARE